MKRRHRIKRLSDTYDWSKGGEEWTQDVQKFKGIDPKRWKVSLIRHMMGKYIKKGGVVLEVGSGAGRWTEPLRRRARRLWVTDISERCLDLCRRRFARCGNLTYHLITEGLAFIKDASLDGIWAYDVFVHIGRKETEKYLEEFRRILKRGGVAVIHHIARPNKEDLKKHLRAHMTDTLFSRLVAKNGMKMLEQNETLAHKPGDIISVFTKP